MLNPDSVSLVTPPRTTAPKHMPAMPPIQYPTIRGVSSATAFPATFCASIAIVVVHLFKAFCSGFWIKERRNGITLRNEKLCLLLLTDCLKFCENACIAGFLQRCADLTTATNAILRLQTIQNSKIFLSKRSYKYSNSTQLLYFHKFFRPNIVRNFSRQIKVENRQYFVTLQFHELSKIFFSNFWVMKQIWSEINKPQFDFKSWIL